MADESALDQSGFRVRFGWGERDAALKWLRRAIELGNENKPWFEHDKNWDSLHDDPEFQTIVDSINTPISTDDVRP